MKRVHGWVAFRLWLQKLTASHEANVKRIAESSLSASAKAAGVSVPCG